MRAHADAAVLDLDHGAAVGQPLAVHEHLGLGRGEHRRVLQQLGHEVDEVVDRVAHHLDVRHAGQLDAVVLLHLGGGRPQHVDQRDRPAPPAARVLTRENQQVLRVAAHTGREVVQLEQVRQLVRVLLAGLQLVDQLELALDQTLRPAGQVDEHVVDVAAQTGLLGRQLDRPLVQLVERPGDVADLVPRVDPDGFDFVRRRRCVRSLQPGDGLRQPDLGDVAGAGLQPPQRADHRPGDEQRGQERDDEDRRDDHTGRDRLPLRIRAQVPGGARRPGPTGPSRPRGSPACTWWPPSTTARRPRSAAARSGPR